MGTTPPVKRNEYAIATYPTPQQNEYAISDFFWASALVGGLLALRVWAYQVERANK